MTSATTPVDYHGRHVATLGHDVMLDALVDRTLNNNLKGAFNILLRPDGRLIADPDHLESIKARKGDFNVSDSNDPGLKEIYALLDKSGKEPGVIDSPKAGAYVAITSLPSTGWYFLTVLPKAVLAAPALKVAQTILLLGLVSLLLEVAIMYFVLQKRVATPLHDFITATDAVAAGESASARRPCTKPTTSSQPANARPAIFNASSIFPSTPVASPAPTMWNRPTTRPPLSRRAYRSWPLRTATAARMAPGAGWPGTPPWIPRRA